MMNQIRYSTRNEGILPIFNEQQNLIFSEKNQPANFSNKLQN